MESQIKKEVFIGFCIGLLSVFFSLYLYIEFVSEFSFSTTIDMIREGDLYGKVLGLAAIPNLFVFFIFIKKKQDYRARGVLMACFLIAFLVLIAQFI